MPAENRRQFPLGRRRISPNWQWAPFEGTPLFGRLILNLFLHRSAARVLGGLVLAALLAVGGIGIAQSTRALELGLTPSHVYATWNNVNDALVAIAQTMPDGKVWQTEFAAMAARRFNGKKPGDVLEQVTGFKAKFGKEQSKIKAAANWWIGQKIEEVTPTEVFLNSYHVLAGVVSHLIELSDRRQLVSQFFVRRKFTGKTPSDVFGLVDLAQRRLDLILAKQSR